MLGPAACKMSAPVVPLSRRCTMPGRSRFAWPPPPSAAAATGAGTGNASSSSLISSGDGASGSVRK